jgi:hypothetical protein
MSNSPKTPLGCNEEVCFENLLAALETNQPITHADDRKFFTRKILRANFASSIFCADLRISQAANPNECRILPGTYQKNCEISTVAALRRRE